MAGLKKNPNKPKNGYLRKNLTQNGKPKRHSWRRTWRRRWGRNRRTGEEVAKQHQRENSPVLCKLTEGYTGPYQLAEISEVVIRDDPTTSTRVAGQWNKSELNPSSSTTWSEENITNCIQSIATWSFLSLAFKSKLHSRNATFSWKILSSLFIASLKNRNANRDLQILKSLDQGISSQCCYSTMWNQGNTKWVL